MYYLLRFLTYAPTSTQSPVLSYHVLLIKVPVLGALFPALYSLLSPIASFLACITW